MQDTRIRRAKQVLVQAMIEAEKELELLGSRSTATRRAYKIKANAADKVLEILRERPPRK